MKEGQNNFSQLSTGIQHETISCASYYITYTSQTMTVLNMNDNNYDRLWEIREVYDILNAAYSKFYNPSNI
jgi:hypothetical protein